MSKKSLLFIIDSLGSGGAQRQMVILINVLIEEYADIDLITYSPNSFFKNWIEKTSVNHIQINRSLALPFRVASQIRKKKYDCILSYLKGPNLVTYFAKLLSRKNVPNITSERSRTNWESINFRKRLNHRSIKKSSLLITNSHHERLNWIERFPELSNRVVTIHNAVDTSLFAPPENQEEVKQFKRIICIGRVVPAKNCECVINALKILDDKNKVDFKLDWIGRHDKHLKKSKDYIDKLDDLIVSSNLKSKWNWLGEEKNIVGHYRSADLLILASHREGLPNVVCESLSCGTPVLLANNLDNPFLVDNNKNGLLFNHLDPTDLAEKITQMYNMDASEFSGKKSNCRSFALANFSYDNFKEKYIKSINKVIEQSNF